MKPQAFSKLRQYVIQTTFRKWRAGAKTYSRNAGELEGIVNDGLKLLGSKTMGDCDTVKKSSRMKI